VKKRGVRFEGQRKGVVVVSEEVERLTEAMKNAVEKFSRVYTNPEKFRRRT
jgi:hypothetical protein